ncbi:hypothetical protein [Mucilaginibacter pedocola]|uniref:WG repeat-containing protein n=1 Tax=Mucilaginibacter pedocola TaxID=1792845 RepID=A0A1S9PC51_9SPHI|nr:hypothetical protein [Mucilaginibacter pedocola]OOQ58535.1 hypothetical protein BC343_07660 [Mucilaginibacter pedocola]
MIIKPQFDWVTVSNLKQKVLVGYNLKGGTVLSSLIYQNKILLSNLPYSEYFYTNGLFVAVKYSITDPTNSNFNDRFVQRDDLFTVDGRKLIDGNFNDITPLDGIEEESLRQTLVSTTDSAYRQSLFLYDKVLKKIVKTYFANSKYVEFTNNASVYYKNRSYTFVFLDEKGIGHQLVIKNDGKALQVVVNKPVNVPPPPPRQHYFDQAFDFPESVFDNKLTPPTETGSKLIKSYERRGAYYYKPKAKEQLKNGSQLLGSTALVFKDGKIGLEDNGILRIPAVYDDILHGDFEGDSGGYVLRQGNKYQLYYYSNGKPMVLPTIFDKIPLLISGYFAADAPLIKLYEDNGEFFCFANSTGKLYYSKQ